ncbi:MAG: hypothetical protein OXM01_11475 [Gemmatimonadota bacterium]|nr:hypothetical protein [Gemmatimonadota bacterium]
MKIHSTKWWYSALRPLAAMAMLGLLASCGGVLEDDDTLCKGDREVCPCLKLLQSNKKIDFESEFGASGKLSKIVFEQSNERTNDPTPALADAFVECLVKVRKPIEVINYARIDTAPLGQIANVWKRQTGFKVHLRPQNEREKQILNNLQIGPSSGVKWDIVERWCRPNVMGKCVECSELNPDEDTVAVEVRLLEGAPVTREMWSDGWPIEGEREPWQLIDDKGVRYLYACRP